MSEFRFDGIPHTRVVQDALAHERARDALAACFESFGELMPVDLYEQIRAVLDLREFESSDIEEGSEFNGPTCI